MTKKRAILSIGLALLALTSSVLPAHADIVMRKRVERHFPDRGSCPFANELELSFIAGGTEAIVTFSATSVDIEPFQIYDVAVVDRETFTSRFKAGVAESCMNGDRPFYDGDVSDVDLIDDPNNWSLTNASLSNTLQLGITSGETQAKASVLVTGLVPGREYFVTGGSDRGDFEIDVDCPPPAAFFLANGRFHVEVRWDVNAQLPGVLTYSEKTAGLWFQDPDHLVMIVSVIESCGSSGNGTYWLMFAGTTANKLRIKVQDTVTGIEKTYLNGSQTRLKTVVDKKTFHCRR